MKPGMYAFYHPNADLGIGPARPAADAMASVRDSGSYRSTENGAGVPSGAQARSVQQTLLICHRSGFRSRGSRDAAALRRAWLSEANGQHVDVEGLPEAGSMTDQ